MTLEEAVEYCEAKELSVEFGYKSVIVSDTGIFPISFWDIDFVGAVEQMRDYIEED